MPTPSRNINGEKSPRQQRLVKCLKKLLSERKEGQTFSRRSIAKHCSVSKSYIGIIERSALKKMRNKLPPDVRQEFDKLLSKGRTEGVARSGK